jgi:regulation of enolase protein 1 (concanavalin A-like superfamily)
MDLSQFHWLNRPDDFKINGDSLTITTGPVTDFWQRTYYGFRHDNAHAFLLPVSETEFSFNVKAAWQPKKMFDQCGVILYQDADNWFKASVEYENEQFSKLGSVVTNLGYSDWATTDIESTRNEMTYRLSRRGQDFLIENSVDGRHFNQMRIFHMHQPVERINIGVYACSPLDSSIKAVFSGFELGKCQWELYVNPEENSEG